MFVEQRLYTFAPGKGGEFDRLYQAEARHVQERYLGTPIGYYYSEIGMLNQVMTLWAYETLNDRVERRERLFKDPEWLKYIEMNAEAGYLLKQESKLMSPAPFAPIKR